MIRYLLKVTCALSLLLISCPGVSDKNNSSGNLENNALLGTLYIAGREVSFGEPGTSIDSAARKEITLTDAEISGAVNISIITQSGKASVKYGKMSSDDNTPIFFTSGPVAFANGDFLVIKITAEDDSVLYYLLEIIAENIIHEQLLILQAYGSASDAAGVNRSFVELYNNFNEDVLLDGYTLYYADGIRGTGITQDGPWKMISLTGTIPSKSSYLIAGPLQSTGARYQIPADYGDINDTNFILSNRSFKAALIHGAYTLTVQNPFNTDGNGTKAEGYIDMIGAVNNPTVANPDNIFGFETAPARNSASEAVRRKNLNDTDNNSADFIAARYAAGGLTETELELRKPRNTAAGAWNPVTGEIIIPPLYGDTVTVAGSYTLYFNSGYDQQKVVIEMYTDQIASAIIGRTQAVKTDKTCGTWSMPAPLGQKIWFKIMVTDETGYTFGRIVSDEGNIFAENTGDITLTLGPFEAPRLETFTLINADASAGVKRNKTGVINQDTGVITFANTSFTIISTDTVMDFHKLAAAFTVSDGSTLCVGNTEQVSEVTTNNYYRSVTFTVVAGDNTRKTYIIAGQNLIVDPSLVNGSASGANNDGDYNRVVGTRSWQTQGFGVLVINTTDTVTGLPSGNVSKLLSGVWNNTGSYTYISPTGRVMSGGTDIRTSGNWTYRSDTYKSYNLKLSTSGSFDYYDYKTKEFLTLPEHKRWRLLAHQGDPTRIRTPLTWEMGRRVLTNMGWQPHSDWVFLFFNGVYKGVYIIAEVIKPEEGRMNITPLISQTNPNGGYVVQLDNNYFYFNEGWAVGGQPSNAWTFDEMWNFMSSHQNQVGSRRQGIVWNMSEPDTDLGWFFDEPPMGDGRAIPTWEPAYTNYFPRNAITLEATLSSGTTYNRNSNPPNLWKVGDAVGLSTGPGNDGFLLNGTLGTDSNGIRYGYGGGLSGNRTLSDVYTGYSTSVFVKVAQFLQDAEDAVYSHDWLTKGYGKGSYLEYIDIGALIDFHIAGEMVSDWEFIILNGRFAHYDPAIKKLKMGPLWDFDNMWNRGDRGANPGFYQQTPFWYKELLGYEITSSNSDNNLQSASLKNPRNHDPYYVAELKARWSTVSNQLNAELDPYITATNNRFSRITGFAQAGGPFAIGTSSDPGNYNNRLFYINHITDMRNRLTAVFNGY